MGGEDTKSDTKTTTQVLTPEQQWLASQAGAKYKEFSATSPTLPGASSIAGFDPSQIAGQNDVLGAADTARGTVQGANTQSQKLTAGDYLDPDNASTAGAIRAATRPITDTYRDVTMPAIGADASTSGSGGISANFGGSRQGVAEGLASRDMINKVGDTSAAIANTARQSNMDQMLKAIGLAPQTAASSSIPGGMTSTVGDIRQGQQQTEMSADTQADQFKQFLPLLMAQWLGQGASSLPGGSTTSVGTSSGSSNPINQLIGGASAAGGLMGGAAKLLPLLGFGSERETKENIKHIRTLPNGLKWYSFNYIGSDFPMEGVMADEVAEVLPTAIFRNSEGRIMVDYKQVLEEA